MGGVHKEIQRISDYSFTAVLCYLLISLASAQTPEKSKRVDDKSIIYPAPRSTQDNRQRQQMIRGEYLTRAGDCIACHTDTKHHGPAFAGGLEFYTPFGSLYSPNITADKETGIGTWSDQDFLRAMQHGIAPDGSYYFPVFPFVSFNKIKQDDLLAIKAYLFSLPPVHKKNRPSEMLWPFNWRFLQLGWRLLFFHPQKLNEPSGKTALWQRGAYLVQGLGHCGMCHTPLNLLGAEKKKYYLTGGFIDGYYAPNISATGLKAASLDDIVAVFKQGKLLGGAGQVGAPMAEVNSNSLRYLTEEDLRAIAVYLKSVQSQTPTSAFSGPLTAQTGRKVYQKYCATCHANGAAGTPKLGDMGEWNKRLRDGIEPVYQRAIQGYNSMPAKGTCIGCSNEAIQAAVDYLAHAQSADTFKNSPVHQRFPSLKMGALIYTQHCAECHAQGKNGAPRFADKTAWAQRIKQGMEILFVHAIQGYRAMPAKGKCDTCSNAEIEAAVKYLVEHGKEEGDYSLW